RLPFPWQQLVQLMVLGSARDDALQHVGQPGQRIDAVQSRRGEKRGKDGPITRASFRTGEEIAVPALGNRAHRTLDSVRVDFHASVAQEYRQAVPMPKGVADRLRQG